MPSASKRLTLDWVGMFGQRRAYPLELSPGRTWCPAMQRSAPGMIAFNRGDGSAGHTDSRPKNRKQTFSHGRLMNHQIATDREDTSCFCLTIDFCNLQPRA
jgi:hypothetical protein